MPITLYKLDLSPPARAVMMTIEALGLKNVEYVDVDLNKKEHLTEEYVKMNPQHTIPTLKDGDFVVWDSHAIISYLIAKYGDISPPLYPTDPESRATIDQRLHFDTGNLFGSLRGAVEPILYAGATAFHPEFLVKIKTNYEFTEAFLTKDFIAGDYFTVADICCIANISSLHSMVPIDEDKFPKIHAWWKRCAEQECYKKANKPGLEAFAAVMANFN